MRRLDRATMASWLFFAAFSQPKGAAERADPGALYEAAVLIDDRRVVPLTLLAQAGVSLGLAIVMWLWRGNVAAASTLLGGMVVVIPNGFLAARLLGPGAGGSAAGLLRAAWIGAVGKMLLTAVLFGAVFALVRPISALAVFAGFIAAQLTIFGVPLIAGGEREADTMTVKS
jgi:ATP synthase protein I